MRILVAIIALLGVLVHPALARAGWGDQNWGEMVWGAAAPPQIPSLPLEGIAGLAALLLVLSYGLLVNRRNRMKEPR